MNEVEALTLLYLSKQDLPNATPKEFADKYAEAYLSIQSALEQSRLGYVRQQLKQVHR